MNNHWHSAERRRGENGSRLAGYGVRTIKWNELVLLIFWLTPLVISFIPQRTYPAGFSPTEAVQRMEVADGLEVGVYASEPEIRQPVAVTFDERGRMWVIQYLQYPAPNGLKPVKVDQFLRTVYDRVPEPPPAGPKGADRITICEDSDSDGHADKFTDFIIGLNLASGLAIGHGGVYVVQSPYLLFYPDRNHDDVPDGDPEVLLSGFGMEDAHAFPNSLQWGPDGWLYGAQGSTVTARIRGVEFQQGVWRYHPLKKEFELFAEGGGNTWGVDFDRPGRIVVGSNGGHVMFHQVQGGYYIKGFSKHGELHNPHAYGYLTRIPYPDSQGGHVTCGGIIYQGGALPQQFHDQYIAGNLLDNAIYWHRLETIGSSFKASRGGNFLVAHDPWFRPIDCQTGPDGAVYIADWYDKRASHLDPQNNWDRSNGRVYRVKAMGSKSLPKFDLHRLGSEELIKLLIHPNDWYAKEARRILAERRDPKILAPLEKNIFESKDERLVLQSLWGLYVSGGFREPLYERLLKSPHADVRAWTIRFLGDSRKISSSIRSLLIRIARDDSSPIVRSQLACSVKRLPGNDALPIIRELLYRGEDLHDEHIPLLLWWAIEDKVMSDREQILKLFASSELWQAPIVKEFIVERIGRRYVAEGTKQDFTTCGQLLDLAPEKESLSRLVSGMEKGLSGQPQKSSRGLEAALAKLWQKGSPSPAVIRFALRLGSEPALTPALNLIADPTAPLTERILTIEVLGQVGRNECVSALLQILETADSRELQNAALRSLTSYSAPQIGKRLSELYPKFDKDLRKLVLNALTGRSRWAVELVQAVNEGTIDAAEVKFEHLRELARHKDSQLSEMLEKRWGKVRPESSQDKDNFINQLALLFNPNNKNKGDAIEGRKLYQANCAVCHTLFNEGNPVGPDLTGADRKNTDYMILNIVNPSANVRSEYANYEVEMNDDRAISGLMVESNSAAVTMLDRNTQRNVLPRDQIRTLRQSSLSLMPEGLLEALTPQQILDLFSYIQSEGPPSDSSAKLKP